MVGYSVGAYSQQEVLDLLSRNQRNISQAAEKARVSPRLLASIIYAEHVLNVKPGEKVLDAVFAYSGYNSSVGIAQMKVNTASWIEQETQNGQDSLSEFLRGKHLLSASADRDELISRLEDPTTNCLYAAIYISMIVNCWRDVFGAPSLRDSIPGLVGTLYSLGLVDSNGKVRRPHVHAQTNVFGRKVQEFFDSSALIEEFPR